MTLHRPARDDNAAVGPDGDTVGAGWDPGRGDAALLAALAGPREARAHAVAAALPASTLLYPLRGAVDAGPPAHARPRVFLPVLLRTRTGREVLPAFSTEAALRRWRTPSRYVAAPGSQVLDLAGVVGAAGLILDPGGDDPMTLVARDDPPAPAPASPAPTAPPSAPSAPSAPPAPAVPPFRRRWGDVELTALPGPLDLFALTRIRQAVAAAPGLVAAWAVELVDPGEVPHLLLAFDPAPGTAPAAAADAAAAVARRVRGRIPVEPYRLVDVVVLTDPAFRSVVVGLDGPVAAPESVTMGA